MPSYRISDHFDGRRFHNTPRRSKGLPDILRWMMTRQRGKWTEIREAEPGPKPQDIVPGPSDDAAALRITFVNHSTFLIQCFGINILTDPIWSERTSPVSWAGPKRMHPAGIRFDDLPKIDVVLLSHDHYDHFDVPTLQRLRAKHNPIYFTGLGNERRLRKLGATRVLELDWWQKVELPGGSRLTCAPARHFSGRTPFDRDTTLWCSFVIEPPKEHRASGDIYFGADTGFGSHFAEVAKDFPRLRVAILPIGAYRPEWFMSEVHCSPTEAVEAHRILGAPLSISCHFGTFPLADDGQYEPIEVLEKILQENPVEGRFVVPEFGAATKVDSLLVQRETMSGTED